MRWRSASVAASSCALLLAGCGGGAEKEAPPRPPRIPADVARKLAVDADLIASAQPGSCTARAAAARLQRKAIQAIQSGRVPARYQEPLMTAANGLVAQLSRCSGPTGRTAEKKAQQQARNLSAWLRRYSG